MKEYLQDKNAGNLGDYLKHFLLIKLIERLKKAYPCSSITYIESHAGAGIYELQEEHWKNRNKYREVVCSDSEQWDTFGRLNSRTEKDKEYYGSFILAGKLLLENKDLISKTILYEHEDNNKEVFERTVTATNLLLLELKPELLNIESTPRTIREKIKEAKSLGAEIVVCLIDPYFKDGKKDSMWCETLSWNDPGLFILMFDFVRAQGKDENGKLRFVWHCRDTAPIKAINSGIKGYAMFGNCNSELQLEGYRSIN